MGEGLYRWVDYGMSFRLCRGTYRVSAHWNFHNPINFFIRKFGCVYGSWLDLNTSQQMKLGFRNLTPSRLTLRKEKMVIAKWLFWDLVNHGQKVCVSGSITSFSSLCWITWIQISLHSPSIRKIIIIIIVIKLHYVICERCLSSIINISRISFLRMVVNTPNCFGSTSRLT